MTLYSHITGGDILLKVDETVGEDGDTQFLGRLVRFAGPGVHDPLHLLQLLSKVQEHESFTHVHKQNSHC